MWKLQDPVSNVIFCYASLQEKFKCDFCTASFKTFRVYAIHLRSHQNEPLFVLRCNNCPRKYTSVRYWRQHVLTCCNYSDEAGCSSSGTLDACVDTESHLSAEPHECDLSNEIHGQDLSAASKYEDTLADNEREISSFLCHLRCDRNLTEAGCIEVADFVNRFCSKSARESREFPHLPPETLPASTSAGSWTAYRLRKIFKNTSVEPRTVDLGLNSDGIRQSFQYVPVLKQLSVLLEHEELKNVFEGEPSVATEPGVYVDWITGENHRQRSGLSLILYYDDFTVVNPVGNKVKRNKLGVFYFVVGNTPFRSRKRHIFLLALFKTSYLKGRHGSRIIRTIVQDIKHLEDVGLPLKGTTDSVTVKGSIALFVADNLAAHTIGGFLESFSKVQKVSRYCNCSSADIQQNLSVTSCNLRTVEEYEQRINELKENGFDHKLCMQYGIKAECEVNALKHFHIIECCPPDLAHDVYEGVIPLVVGHVLGELIKLKVLSLSEINDNIRLFPYAASDATNKPQLLTLSKGKVKCTQTAKESFNLLRLLPLMIGYKVPKDLPVWTILVTFLGIVRFLIAPKFDEQDLCALQKKIESWLASFVKYFQDLRITPKLHYVLHYTNQIRRHGALSRITTLRFESKNQALKGFLSTSRNHKNVCKTIARKHQQWLADKVRRSDFFSWKTEFHSRQRRDVGTGEPGEADSSSKVVIRGTIYRQGDVVAFTKDGAIQFAEIVCIQRKAPDFSFFCKCLKVVEFDKHVASFRVASTYGNVVVDHCELTDYHPLHRYAGRYVLEHHALTKPEVDQTAL